LIRATYVGAQQNGPILLLAEYKLPGRTPGVRIHPRRRFVEDDALITSRVSGRGRNDSSDLLHMHASLLAPFATEETAQWDLSNSRSPRDQLLAEKLARDRTKMNEKNGWWPEK
jgi:hypothetical protein